MASNIVDLDEERRKRTEYIEDESSAKELFDSIFGKSQDEDSDPSKESGLSTIIVLDDGETWSGGGSVLRGTPGEIERIEEGEKPYSVINPDHGRPDARWTDIWDLWDTSGSER